MLAQMKIHNNKLILVEVEKESEIKKLRVDPIIEQRKQRLEWVKLYKSVKLWDCS